MALKVYVSYAWKAEEDSGVVAALETALAGQGVDLVRDVGQVGYGESIRAFMDEIGAADQVVLVLSEVYFRSPYCLYELRALDEHRDFRRRVHPIVLAGCDLHDPLWWIDIVAHWEERRRVLEAKLATISRANIGPLNQTVDDYADFRRLVTGQMATLADMNALTEEVHRVTDFAALVARLKAGRAPAVVPKSAAGPSEPSPPVQLPVVKVIKPDMPTPWWTEKVEQDKQGTFVNVAWLGVLHRLNWDAHRATWWGTSAVGVDEYGLFGDLDLLGIGQRFRWIPPGEFRMGSPSSEVLRAENEGPQHLVRISEGFWIAESVCSQALWRTVMKKTPSCLSADVLHPVGCVSWDDVQGFLRRVEEIAWGYFSGMTPAMRVIVESLHNELQMKADLPSEAEWEYACRAGSTSAFAWGESIDSTQASYDASYPYGDGPVGDSRKIPAPVKFFRPNKWGLYQMHGNVWEWCRDGMRDYADAARVDPCGPKGEASRVVRGGAWNAPPKELRAACRHELTRGSRLDCVSFRLVLRLGRRLGSV